MSVGASPSTTPTASLSYLASPSNTPSASVGSGCFAADSMVQLADGSYIALSSLSAGDLVRSVSPDGEATVDKVFRVSHHAPEATGAFLRFTLASGHSLAVTPSHFVHAGTCCSPREAVKAARDVRVGDVMFTLEEGELRASEVVSVAQEEARGQFNVHTLGSNLLVNGVVASHFTEDSSWRAGWTRGLAQAWYGVLDAVSA